MVYNSVTQYILRAVQPRTFLSLAEDPLSLGVFHPPSLSPLLLPLLLSRFSHVQLCAAHQAPPPLGFSRKEHWSGLPFPSPVRESEVAQSCQTLRDPVDCSPPGSSAHGIFQARVLEWVAIAFSCFMLTITKFALRSPLYEDSYLCYILGWKYEQVMCF